MSLEPLSLVDLAVALRDDLWLDMRVIDERPMTLERVRVETITVKKDGEDVALVQEHKTGEGVTTYHLVVDAECIRWAKPTSFELEEVEPWSPTGERRHDKAGSEEERVWLAAERAVANHFNMDLHELQKTIYDGGDVDRSRLRYWVMLAARWVAANCSALGLTAETSCARFGYRSVMPLQSASYHEHREKDVAHAIYAKATLEYELVRMTTTRKAA